MQKFILLLLTLSILSTKTNAQNDAAAKKILDAVSTKVKSFKGITGSFTIVLRSGNDRL